MLQHLKYNITVAVWVTKVYGGGNELMQKFTGSFKGFSTRSFVFCQQTTVLEP